MPMQSCGVLQDSPGTAMPMQSCGVSMRTCLLVCMPPCPQVALASSSGNSRDKNDDATLQNWWNLRLRGEGSTGSIGCCARHSTAVALDHDYEKCPAHLSMRVHLAVFTMNMKNCPAHS
jgi:hypothetical protein